MTKNQNRQHLNLAPVVERNLGLKWGGNQGNNHETQKVLNAKMEGYLLRYVTLSRTGSKKKNLKYDTDEITLIQYGTINHYITKYLCHQSNKSAL